METRDVLEIEGFTPFTCSASTAILGSARMMTTPTRKPVPSRTSKCLERVAAEPMRSPIGSNPMSTPSRNRESPAISRKPPMMKEVNEPAGNGVMKKCMSATSARMGMMDDPTSFNFLSNSMQSSWSRDWKALDELSKSICYICKELILCYQEKVKQAKS